MLRRQARTPQHPNIVAIHSVLDDGPPCCLVMEYVEGANLRQVVAKHLARHGRGLPVGAATKIFRQIAAALQGAHEMGVCHGDLKPENVLVGYDLGVKVTDFGVIRTFGDASLHHSLSVAGERRAPFTPIYVAPEVRRGGTFTPTADIYALGIVLHELFTGELPHGADPPSSVRSDVPAWADEVFALCYTGVDRRVDFLEPLLALVANASAPAGPSAAVARENASGPAPPSVDQPADAEETPLPVLPNAPALAGLSDSSVAPGSAVGPTPSLVGWREWRTIAPDSVSAPHPPVTTIPPSPSPGLTLGSPYPGRFQAAGCLVGLVVVVILGAALGRPGGKPQVSEQSLARFRYASVRSYLAAVVLAAETRPLALAIWEREILQEHARDLERDVQAVIDWREAIYTRLSQMPATAAAPSLTSENVEQALEDPLVRSHLHGLISRYPDAPYVLSTREHLVGLAREGRLSHTVIEVAKDEIHTHRRRLKEIFPGQN
jgi:serine/threonine protein kinase